MIIISAILEKLKNGYNPMMEGVRWAEQYATQIERFWKFIPNWLGQTLVFISIFLFASGIQGKMYNKCNKQTLSVDTISKKNVIVSMYM